MNSELKVSNQFGELILHVRYASGDNPMLLTIDATNEMKHAILHIAGKDFDRVVVSGNEPHVIYARWGAPEFLRVLAHYFVGNYGWNTTVLEAFQASTLSPLACSGNLVSSVGQSTADTSPAASYCFVASLTANNPRRQPRAVTNSGVESKAVAGSAQFGRH